MIKNQEEYLERIAYLNELSHHYYVLDDPLISDEDYDKLYKELKDYEEKNPSNIASNSPTQKVGATILDAFTKNSHLARMWSLDDVFDSNELQTWLNRILKIYPNTKFVCSPKLDGVSLNLLYNKGKLVSATTRGNGLEGELVTHNAQTIATIPQTIAYDKQIEIRGEVIISKDDFETLNKERLESNESLFANPRNAAAGSLRQLDSSITKKRKLQFIPWGVGEHSLEFQSFKECLDFIISLGFAKIPYLSLAPNLNAIESCYQDLLKKRDDLEALLDGMVIVVDALSTQNELGYTQKSPKFACAYKFPAIEKHTRILEVINQVGRSGAVTPVALLEPVEIAGALITKATLHNYSEIEKKNIMLNDMVVVIRSGDVIPKIIKPLEHYRDGSQHPIIRPSHCPICSHELLCEEIFTYCQNINCSARLKESLIHFASKDALNIQGLGDKVIEQLFEEKLILNALDLYTLKLDDLMQLDKFKIKKAQNLLDAINKSKNPPLWRLINALGIEHIGKGASKTLAKYGLNVLEKSEEEFLEIEGFGVEMAHSLANFYASNKEFIQALFDLLNPIIEEKIEILSHSIFSYKTIVLTGTLSKPRQEYAQMLENLGAKIASSVSAKTDFLIAGENAGSKLAQAQKHGVTILNEEELLEKLNEQAS
ncbi:NAD-dependent DNA ligase LigA [Helicobacter cetorum]|uniref:NAD-dependent DNA ligase LigA n=1 Tax=Helicobacter cetorum TaxID=138563 RepID=UPI000CF16337|nr:NAD-dependent DNA ligase LigA [Helicobacter cetorum]